MYVETTPMDLRYGSYERKDYWTRVLVVAIVIWIILRIGEFLMIHPKDNRPPHEEHLPFKTYEAVQLEHGEIHRIPSRTANHGQEQFWLYPDFLKFRVLDEPTFTINKRPSDIRFVIFIHSRSDGEEKRNRVRSTWANEAYYRDLDVYSQLKPVVIFVVGINASGIRGEHLERRKIENSEFSDILVLDMVDSYENLTVKSLLTMNWIKGRFPNARYIYKTDDDIMLNVFSWMTTVQELDRLNVSCSTIGLVWQHGPVFRSSRYNLSREQYKPDFFPSFCSGSGYLMSRDAMESILDATPYIPPLPRDDPYITGILAEASNVRLYDVGEINYKVSNQHWYQPILRKTILNVHNLTTVEWHDIWSQFLQLQKTGSHAQLKMEYVASRTIPFSAGNDSYYPVTDMKIGVCGKSRSAPVKHILVDL